MFEIKITIIVLYLFNVVPKASASTHWIVTKHGRILSQIDSVYRLHDSSDLMAFLEQEERAESVAKLYKDMTKQKVSIDLQWSSLETASEVENRLHLTDDDCLLATRPLSDRDLYASVVDYASDRIDSKSCPTVDGARGTIDLNCTRFASLDFSMTTFPHLRVLSQPWNISWAKENDIELPLSPDRIECGLRRNTTSWHLHNLASLYWRKVGDGQQALDCMKRAVHFAPREYKDTPLLNLGVMLQRAHCTAEAAILLHSSIDHAPHKPMAHFALANVYAILGDYNRSVACFDNVLGLDPGWTLARRNKHALICHKKLEERLFKLHKNLDDILLELKNYDKSKERWLKLRQDLIESQAPPNQRFTSFFNRQGDFCVPDFETENGQLKCEGGWREERLQPELSLSLQALLESLESQAQKLNEISWRVTRKKPRNEPDEGSGLEILIEENDPRSGPDKTEENSNFSKHPS